MAKYRFLGDTWTLDGKLYRNGDELTLTDDVARSLMDHHHALVPLDDGVQPRSTGVSDIVAAGVAVDEFGDPITPKTKK